MQVWVLKDGEKQGPMETYQVVGKIQRNEYSAEDLAWHRGLDKWMPLAEMGAFSSHFISQPDGIDSGEGEFDDQPSLAPYREILAKKGPPALPQSPRLMRRFWARWLDLIIYMTMVYGYIYFADVDIVSITREPSGMLLFWLVPWFVIEAALLHMFGATPGKAILGIKVLAVDGNRLGIGTALLRSLRVWVMGLGMGIGPIFVIALIVSYFFTKKFGYAIWDLRARTQVHGTNIGPARIAVYVACLFLVGTVNGILAEPWSQQMMKEMLPPEVYKKYEEALKASQPAGDTEPAEKSDPAEK